jgi:hypothetical protein
MQAMRGTDEQEQEEQEFGWYVCMGCDFKVEKVAPYPVMFPKVWQHKLTCPLGTRYVIHCPSVGDMTVALTIANANLS